MNITAILLILFLHFLADFPLQSAWMSDNKGKNIKALLAHVGVHFLLLSIIGIYFALLNAFLHLIIDSITSRITSKLWKNGKEYWFWVVIGLDQLLHYVCLFGTYFLLKNYGLI